MPLDPGANQTREVRTLITHTGTYAIRAVVYLSEVRAHAGRRTNVTAAAVAQATGVPRNYLTKILHALAQAGVLDSTRGPRGGFRLADGADLLTLIDVLAPFAGMPGHGCLLSQEGCPEGARCPSYERCLTLTGQMDQFLRTTRIRDLAQVR